MRRRLDLAGALVVRPRVLFLDEPTTGLDPRSRIGLWEVIRSLVADGTTVLLTTQYLEEADQLADDISVIDEGRVIAAGTPNQLKTELGGHRVVVVLQDGSDAQRNVIRLRRSRHVLEALAHRTPSRRSRGRRRGGPAGRGRGCITLSTGGVPFRGTAGVRG